MRASVVLVGTKHAFNVGLVSRVMSNYGIEELILVAPRCAIDVDAYHGASGGNTPLKNLVRVSDWTQFLNTFPPGYRLGFFRRVDQPYARPALPIESAARDMAAHVTKADEKIYLVFGREDIGLTNEDLNMMNGTQTFPTWDYPSLSLSHAVTTGLLLFRLASELERETDSRQAAPQGSAPYGSAPSSSGARSSSHENTPEPTSEIEVAAQAGLENFLTTLGLSLEMPNNAATKFAALLRRAAPSVDEWSMLKKIFFQTARKLKIEKKSL